MGDFGRFARGAVTALVAMGLAGAVLAQDGIRLLDGSLTYRERIALPPGAVAVVEARDGRDRLLAEATLATRGAQVPVPFQLGLPAGVDTTLHASLIVDGRPLWYMADLPIPAGTDPVSLGEVVLSRFVPTVLQGTLRCGDTVLQFGIFENDAVIEIDGRRIVLPRVANSPDSRFAVADSPATVLSENGDTITITLEGTALGACSPIPPPVPQPIRARGNEPGWTLEISDGNLRLTTDYGAATLEASVGEPRFEGGAFLYETAEATIRLAPGLCRDDMTGMPYPETAEVRLGSRRLTGCGGEPSALLQGEWIVEDIGGAGIVESSRITLAFDGSALGGEASCNRYATSFVIGGEGVSVGQIAATKRMCPEVLMEQELRFFRALDKVGRFDIDQTGALLLFDPASPEPIITARR